MIVGARICNPHRNSPGERCDLFATGVPEKDEAVHFLSYFDSLTGLAKRPLFCQRLAQRLSDDAADGNGRTVVVFDIQKLAVINDSLGRYVGDRLIEKVAVRLKQAYSDPECVAYFGGGTFAVMLAELGNTTDTGRLMQNAAAQTFVEPFFVASGFVLKYARQLSSSFTNTTRIIPPAGCHVAKQLRT